MKILVVEDQKKIADALRKGLVYEGYIVDIASDGDQALLLLTSVDYDVVILDWMIPGSYDGKELCVKLRELGKQPGVLMLTAKNTLGDKIAGLDAGADDYLAKPFAFEELLARVRSLLRRPKLFEGTSLTIDSLSLDTVKKTVTRAGKPIVLTAKEFSLLSYLLSVQGRIVSKEELMDHVWSDDGRPLPNTIEAFIKRIREKIDRPFKNEAKLIHTKRGFGYKLGVAP